jgi:hypothetical protein
MLRCMKAIVLSSLVVVPTSAYAQASIVGTFKDASGAVLPGATVEASSPARIEKTRSVVSGGTGQYSIENMRPDDKSPASWIRRATRPDRALFSGNVY